MQLLPLEEQLPVLDLAGVPDERRYRQLLRRTRNREQLQAGLVRQAVCLLLVHFLSRPDQVLPDVLATARAGHDVVQAALVRAQDTAGVLAAVAVALTDGPGTELRALLGHLGVIYGHDDGRHTNLSPNGVDRV